MQKRVRALVGLVGTVSIAASLASVACGDDSPTPAAPGVDSGGLDGTSPSGDSATATETGPLDSGAQPDANPTDGAATDATNDATMDAGADADAMTNNSVWSADAGLPGAACAAWTLVDTAPGTDPIITDGGVMELATAANGQNMYWRQEAVDLITPPTIILDTQVRLISGTTSNASRTPINIVVRYGSPLKTAAMHIGLTEVFLTSADVTRGQAMTVATTDALHTYRFTIDTTTHAMAVSRDGTPILTGTAYTELDVGQTPSIYFGEASNLATGTSWWGSVTHNAHALAPCP